MSTIQLFMKLGLPREIAERILYWRRRMFKERIKELSGIKKASALYVTRPTTINDLFAAYDTLADSHLDTISILSNYHWGFKIYIIVSSYSKWMLDNDPENPSLRYLYM